MSEIRKNRFDLGADVVAGPNPPTPLRSKI
jgi:hypothetical protein